tara:strand:+ start:88 stop:510 length:423 start_codon:yes stop_codon:yes gene_type:complete
MRYQPLKQQSNFHWYEFNDGSKIQIKELSKMIEKLFEEERLTTSEVSEKINMKKGTVTHVIRTLCVKSILSRQSSGKNKQTVYFKEPKCLLAELYHPVSSVKFKVLKRTTRKIEDGANVSHPLSTSNHRNSFTVYDSGNE